jgi:hypothetical protein
VLPGRELPDPAHPFRGLVDPLRGLVDPFRGLVDPFQGLVDPVQGSSVLFHCPGDSFRSSAFIKNLHNLYPSRLFFQPTEDKLEACPTCDLEKDRRTVYRVPSSSAG